MPRKRLSTKLAEAHQEIRDLKNEVHRLSSAHMPLEHQVLTITRENERLKQKEDELRSIYDRQRDRLSDAELYALAAYVHTETGQATPARQKLFEQLAVRGVLATGKEAA
jgi:predicted  nucleic acid-binding Zn-ribbon protein